MLEWYNTMFENRAPYLPGHIWVDVRDAALAHVLALEKKEAGGERILLSSGEHCSIIVRGMCNFEPDVQDLSFGKNGVCIRLIDRLTQFIDMISLQ
jgi:hypothetical protein